jgi:hypothetical protein
MEIPSVGFLVQVVQSGRLRLLAVNYQTKCENLKPHYQRRGNKIVAVLPEDLAWEK